MRPFLLLGDISGFLVMLGLGVLAFGGLLVFAGTRLARSSSASMGSKVLGWVVIVFGTLVILSAFCLFFIVWEDQPERSIQRQWKEIQENRQAALNAPFEDTAYKARDREIIQERDSAWRHLGLPDSIAPTRAKKAELEW